MQYDQSDIELMALCLWREARGEGQDGMRAVGHVIKNRVGAPGFAKTLRGVILGPNEFSSMSVSSDPEYTLQPGPNDPQFAYCQQIAPAILAGNDVDNTLNALFYANEVTMTSGWYKRVIIDSGQHPITVVIGKQTFRK